MKVYIVKQPLEIIKSTQKAYCFTVKSLGKDPDANYDPFFDKLKHFKVAIEYNISERDPKGKLHYHGILYIPKGFYRKRLVTKGFNIKLEEMGNRKAWLKYIHKDVLPEDWPDLSDEDEYIDEPKITLTGSLFKRK
jgi:hypothetical protein